MPKQISRKSLLRSVKTLLKQFEHTISDEEYTKIRGLVDLSQYQCCEPVEIFWVGNVSPSDYQLQFKDANGTILAQTDLAGATPQTIIVPARSAKVCINVVNAVSLNTGTYQLNAMSYSLVGADTVGVHCNVIKPIESTYILTSIDGDCPVCP